MFSQISSSPHCEAAQRAHFIGLRIAGITVDTQQRNEIKAHGVLAYGAFAVAHIRGDGDVSWISSARRYSLVR